MTIRIGAALGAAALVALAVATAGASATTQQTPAGPAKPSARTTPALSAFASCTAFASHMRREGRRIVGPYGLPGQPAGVGPAVFTREAMPAPMPALAPADAGAPVAGRDFSGTNLQEGGVDEPDIVKTDGRRIYALAGTTVRAVDVTGDRPRLVGSLDVAHLGPQSLMLVGGRLLVLGSTGGGAAPMPMPAREIAVEPTPGVTPRAAAPRVIVVELDISDPARMRARGRVTADGTLVAARRTGTGLRLVVASRPRPVPLAVPRAHTAAALRTARLANRRALAATRAADWLPRLTVRRQATGATVRRVIAGCRGVARPRAFSGLGMVTVLTVATDRGLTVTDSDAVLTDAGVVYASPSSLYVATPRWVNPMADASGSAPAGTTLVHRFDISSATRTEHAGSAAVPGYPLNQFSLSEHREHLRIATTQEPAWWDAPGAGERSQSFVTVLSARDGRLVRTGQVGGLGRGERIYSARFMGDRAYVVTFRQVDPLYSLDLSDPAAPRVTGELKINGYSAYLHPVDDDTLIGIGQDATDEGRILGTQVSLFDVSDPANPTRLAQKRLGPGMSEAESNHLAVLYWPATGLLAIPLDSWGGPDGSQPPFTGAVGLGVSRTGGIRDVGRISHGTGVPVRRSVVVGDALYTVSHAGIARNALADLAGQGFARFP